MEEAPGGTPVGVDDPYAVAGACDHLTDDGRCRLALAHPDADPDFTRERAADDYACVAAAGDSEPDPAGTREGERAGPGFDGHAFEDCRHYRWTTDGRECIRCGLLEVRIAHDPDERPLVEEHHLSYGGGDGAAHEITVGLCRWCHAKVHQSFARVTDDAAPDPEATAERERRRGAEREEAAFESAAERFDREE